MNPIKEKVVTSSLLTKNTAETKVREYFNLRPNWGKAVISYKGFFTDRFGVLFHAFEIVTDDGKGNALQAIVTEDLTDIFENKTAFAQIIDSSTPVQ